jgi:hypothetical protein
MHPLRTVYPLTTGGLIRVTVRSTTQVMRSFRLALDVAWQSYESKTNMAMKLQQVGSKDQAAEPGIVAGGRLGPDGPAAMPQRAARDERPWKVAPGAEPGPAAPIRQLDGLPFGEMAHRVESLSQRSDRIPLP